MGLACCRCNSHSIATRSILIGMKADPMSWRVDCVTLVIKLWRPLDEAVLFDYVDYVLQDQHKVRGAAVHDPLP